MRSPRTEAHRHMLSPEDTIVAIATPPGRGGIGVVRISGPRATAIGQVMLERRAALEARRATLTRVRAPASTGSPAASGELVGHAIDEVIATWFPAPHSYTGQHVLEISAHGSPIVLQAIVRLAVAAGARLAEPGEFTLRAFLNGKRDLIQAEAVGDLIAAATPLQARVAFDQLDGTLTRRITDLDSELFDLIARLEASLDFPDEGYHFIEPAGVVAAIDGIVARIDRLLGDAHRGRLIREGATVVIAGRPNVGKSSVFNALVGTDRAIVTEVPGTTRDLVSERIDLEGLAVTLVDTAGTRETHDIVELEGVRRGTHARAAADLVLVVLDVSAPLGFDDEQLLSVASRRLVVANKVDLPPAWEVSTLSAGGQCVGGVISVSATIGEGVAALRRAMVRALTGADPARDPAAISNIRHIELLEGARRHLLAAREAASSQGLPEEFVLADLHAARARFEEVVGTRTPEEVLQHIFERFCIGK